MKLGDLVRHLDRMWSVTHYDPRRTRTASLLAADGAAVEVPYDLDKTGGLVVVANPADNWPFLTIPDRPKLGKLLSFWKSPSELQPIVDWVPAEWSRSGGAIFFNPAVQLRYGDMIVARYEKGSPVRVDIPRSFGTVRQKSVQVQTQKAEAELVKEKTAFSKLLEDRQIGDED